jgi:heterodisulfide reductase subunit A
MRPIDFSSDGIYMCGTAHGPKNIPESITQALAAASHASIPLKKGKIKTDAVIATVDLDLCIGCGACASICPFDAIIWKPTGQPYILDAVCKGCGLCAVECPVGAMQLRYFKDDQLIPAIQGILAKEFILEADESEEPIVLAFACRWCSYAAADIAGVMRLKYPTNVRLILVPCTGRVDFRHIFESLEKGADGVVVAGCLKEQCHYIDGNLVAERRVNSTKKVLQTIGIDPERVEMLFVSAGMPREFVQFMKDFTEKIKQKGRIKRDKIPALAKTITSGGS